MPKTLRDAVLVTRNLQVKYLWIDALCIIQGSDEKAQKDWEIESGNMEKVYGNAFITIAAAASDACDGGLFYPRSCLLPLLAQPADVNKNDLPPRKSIMAFIPTTRIRTRGVKDEPLNNRAWALQERVLSKRILTYTFGGINFQCSQCTWNLTREREESRKWPAYIYTFPSPPAMPAASDWNVLVLSFSTRNLSNPRDKLPAIAGLARRFHILTHGKYGCYLAGLWEKSLLAGLLWCRNDGMAVVYPKSKTGAAKTYRAPSWSWAAVDGIIWYSNSQQNSLDSDKFATRVLECTTETTITGDPFSTILSGKLIIAGPCKLATGIEMSSRGPLLIDSSYNDTKHFTVAVLFLDDDDDATIAKIKDIGKLSCLFMTDHGDHYGLLLIEAPGAEGCYVRIGLILSQTSEERKWWEDAVETTLTIV